MLNEIIKNLISSMQHCGKYALSIVTMVGILLTSSTYADITFIEGTSRVEAVQTQPVSNTVLDFHEFVECDPADPCDYRISTSEASLNPNAGPSATWRVASHVFETSWQSEQTTLGGQTLERVTWNASLQGHTESDLDEANAGDAYSSTSVQFKTENLPVHINLDGGYSSQLGFGVDGYGECTYSITIHNTVGGVAVLPTDPAYEPPVYHKVNRYNFTDINPPTTHDIFNHGLSDEIYLMPGEYLLEIALTSISNGPPGPNRGEWHKADCNLSFDVSMEEYGTSIYNPLVNGTVTDRNGVGIPDVTIDTYVNGLSTPYASTITDANGDYQVEVLADFPFEIVPSKDSPILDGLDILDVYAINRHIIGVEPLQDPYKRIAADVDESCSIYYGDLSEMQGVLLNVTQAFSSNKVWRFVNSDVSLPTSPSSIPCGFEESRTHSGINSDIAGQDFVGVKLGDVDGNVAP